MTDDTLACGLYQLEHAATGDNSSAVAVLAHIKRLEADRATIGGRLRAEATECAYLEGENERLQAEVEQQRVTAAVTTEQWLAKIHEAKELRALTIGTKAENTWLTADLAQLREMYQDRDSDLAFEFGRANALEAEVERLQDENERLTDAWLQYEHIQPDGELGASIGDVLADNERLNAEVARLTAWKEDADKALREEWRQRLLAFITGDGQVCIRCMEMTHDPDHWKDCPKHPARAEVERLQAELATAKLQLADCIGDLSLSAELRRRLQANVRVQTQMIDGQRAEVERLRTALGHYADRSRWVQPFDPEHSWCWFLTDSLDAPWHFAQDVLADQIAEASQS